MPQFYFWKYIVGKTNNEFCYFLIRIAVDETHLIWGYQEFRKDYRYIGLLYSYFLNVLIVGSFVTMTKNVLDYVHTFLNLRLPKKFHKQSLDCLNITYDIVEIRKPGYKEQDLFILSIGSLSAIL